RDGRDVQPGPSWGGTGETRKNGGAAGRVDEHGVKRELAPKVNGQGGPRLADRCGAISRNEDRLPAGGLELAGKVAPALLVSGVEEAGFGREPSLDQSG